MKNNIKNLFSVVVISGFLAIGLLLSAPGSVISAHAGGGEAPPEGEASTGSEYVELSPLILPIIDSNGLTQTVSLVIAIEVSNSWAASKIESIAPKLQDAYIQDMYGMLSAQSNLKPGGIIQVRELKKRLIRLTRAVAGDDIVDDVLLQVVSQHPI